MLVLTRKAGQQVIIGQDIRPTVLAIRGNHVRLGLLAPDDVRILREELSLPISGVVLTIDGQGNANGRTEKRTRGGPAERWA